MTLKREHILVVDDDPDLCSLLKNRLEKEGLRCETAVNLDEMKDYLHRFSYSVVLLDLHMGDVNALNMIPVVLKHHPFTKVIVMTADESVNNAVIAMEKGATTFIPKSKGYPTIIEKVKEKINIISEERNSFTSKTPYDTGIIGNSRAIRRLLIEVDKIKNINATVLILGESGTGKELVARALHNSSLRRQKPFEAINCGAIPENLLESELFGYKKGAFTDAKNDRIGLFQHCTDGSLFLDEMGDIPSQLQVKLLRVLQEREVRKIGSSKSVKVDTRVIAATNRNLEQEVKNNKFREDLFYRLSVFTINIPPLRERREDISALVEHFINTYNQRHNRQVAYPSHEIMARLTAYDWPGNIRELQNSIERAVVFSQDSKLHLDDIFYGNSTRSNLVEENNKYQIDSVLYADAKENFERSFLKKVLSISRGNVSEAARISGRFRSDIYRLIKRYEVKPEVFK